MPKTVMVASNNAHKLQELREIFAMAGLTDVDVVCPGDLGLACAPDETGTTYLENALIKARAFREAAARRGLSELWVLADDSGLEVDALGGRPGVQSSCYYRDAPGGDGCAALLREMADVPDVQRTARFRCALVLIGPQGQAHIFEGICEGRIARERRGAHGFGFDPVFLLDDGRTMAQLSAAEKHRVSHRGIAGRRAAAFLLHQEGR
ncbi:MAG: RdgB/HAM1 family non-canonical purine NTP pyrophosphatase [Thermoflexales bacterium]|nr:RdgB/HAM1 family non-canonical purine NTP pyrophosphatase [Thermoflexales bacterium]MDW8352716.1 RdgB/HAM1 family non-canonical purine NTP pyrophosphatase [Anaerolineae bacterium]